MTTAFVSPLAAIVLRISESDKRFTVHPETISVEREVDEGEATMGLRFSISALLVLILFFGISFAALSSPSNLWANTLFTLALGALTVGLLNVLFNQGSRRIFWGGFLVCGTVYFTTVFGPWFSEESRPCLLTTALLDIVYPRIAQRRSATGAASGSTAVYPVADMIVPVSPPRAGGGGPPGGGMGGMGGGGMGGGMMAGMGRMAGATRAATGARGPGALTSAHDRWAMWTDPNQAPVSGGVGLGAGAGRSMALANQARRFSLLVVPSDSFQCIGHSVLTLVLAFLGESALDISFVPGARMDRPLFEGHEGIKR
jgi:hypothetical protein